MTDNRQNARFGQQGGTPGHDERYRAARRPSTVSSNYVAGSAPGRVRPATRSIYTSRVAQSPRMRTAERKHRASTGIVVAIAALIIAACLVFGLTALLSRGLPADGEKEPQGDATVATIQDDQAGQTENLGAGDIVMGINGDEETVVLLGEEYLEAGAHAAEPTDGILTGSIETSGSVDTSTAGDYTITYRVSDSTGHTASIERTVHVVESMDTMQDGMPILMYHYVYDVNNPPESIDGNYLASDAFEQHLQYLSENDFYYPSYQEVRAFLQGTHSLPSKSVVLTFDDGEAGFLNVGVPLLEKYQVPATSFIICNEGDAQQKVIDHRSRWCQYQSHSYHLHQAGGSIGHGGLISALTKDELVEDFNQSKQVLGAFDALAYPYGDVTDDGKAAAQEAGVQCAFTTENRWACVGDDVYALPRVRISGTYTQEGFVYLVNNLQ